MYGAELSAVVIAVVELLNYTTVREKAKFMVCLFFCRVINSTTNYVVVVYVAYVVYIVYSNTFFPFRKQNSDSFFQIRVASSKVKHVF